MRPSARPPLLLLVLLLTPLLLAALASAQAAPNPVQDAAAAPIVTASASGIKLTWSDPASGTWTGTRIYRATSSGGTYTLLSDVAPGTRTYSDLATSLVVGTTYYYSIRAHNSGTEATGNPEVSAVAPSPFGINLAPSAILAVSGVDTSLATDQCTWNPGPKFNCAVDGSLTTYDIVHNGDGLTDNSCARTSNPNNYFEIDWGGDKLIKRIKARIEGRFNSGCANLTLVTNSGALKELTAWSITANTANNYEIVLPEATEARKLRFHWSANGGGWFQQRFYDIHINQLADSTAPGPVTNLQAATGANYVNLTWDAPQDSDLMDYAIYRDASLLGTTTNRYWNDTTVTPGTTYVYRVAARDTAYNYAPNASVSAQPLDNVPPGAPTGLNAVGQDRAVALTWNAPSDTDLAGYIVYRAGTQVGTTNAATRSFTDSGLVNGQSYSYTVSAYDTSRNVGPNSTAATATAADSVPPGTPAPFTATPGSLRVDLAWTAPNDYDLAGFELRRGGVLIATPGPSSTSYADTGLAEDTSYTYTLRAKDTSGNTGSDATATARTFDTTAPGLATGLTATTTPGQRAVELAWTKAPDADLAQQRIYRNGALLATIGTNQTYRDEAVQDQSTYTYHLVSVDSSQNAGGASSSASATVPDTTGPGQPTNLQATPGDRTLTLTWSAPSSPDVAGYRVYLDGAHVASTAAGTRTATLSNLVNGQTYALRVSAVDTAANEGALSATVSATPRDATPPVQVAGLRVTHEGNQRADVAWDPNPESDLAAYLIYLDGAHLATTSLLTRSLTGLENDRTYTVAVHAMDASGNHGQNATIQVRPHDDIPPGAPTGLLLAGHDRRVHIRWTPPADVDLAGVRIYRDGVHIANVPKSSSEWNDTTVRNLKTYTYQVRAYDYSANTGTGPSATVTPVDDVAPAQPRIYYSHGWDQKVELKWWRLSDSVTYRVVRDGVLLAQGITGGDYYDTTAQNGEIHVYRIIAVDAAGNAGPASEPVTLGAIAPSTYDQNVQRLREGPVEMFATNAPVLVLLGALVLLLCAVGVMVGKK